MAELTCPAGMVLQKEGGAVHPDESAFCINETEVPQSADQRFWAERQKSGFELVIKKKDGSTETFKDRTESSVKQRAALEILDNDVTDVGIHPVAFQDKLPQPDGNRADPNKAATLRTWHEAKEYCRSVYPGGDLPTRKQWEKACGGKKYCTTSGRLRKTEADYGKSYDEGPAAVDAFPANPNGVRGMTGGVWEWSLDGDFLFLWGHKFRLGGSWVDDAAWGLGPDERNCCQTHHDARSNDLGFRCVAPPQETKPDLKNR